MDEEEIDSGDKLAMSFLDVISCGFGGAVLLGLIFMVVRQGGATQTSSPDFIQLTWEVQENNSPGVFPLINVVIQPPDSEVFDLDLESFDVATGKLKRTAVSQLRLGEEISVLGFSRFGERPVYETPSAGFIANMNDSFKPRYQVLITNPRPGLWQIGTRYQNARNFMVLPMGVLKTNKIKVDVAGITRYSTARIPSNASDLRYSEVVTNLSYLVKPIVRRK